MVKHGYIKGYKRCSTCIKFMKTEETRCYCCGVKYKTGPYQSKDKRKKLEAIVRY